MLRAAALAYAAVLVVSRPSAAVAQQQTPPVTPPANRAQADALLQSRPDLAAQLRQRIGASGLTPEQIRTRLRAEGYPENLLDTYLSTGALSSAAAPSADVFAAVRALGLADSTDVAGLMALAGMDRARPPVPRYDPAASSDPSLARASAVIFGLSLFRDGTSQFVPNLDGPVDQSYRLGPGDELILILTGDVERAYPLTITREGFIVIPDVGQLAVAGLTLGQLENLLYTRLGRAYSGVRRSPDASTRFAISVSKLRLVQVVVAGDVMTPGQYRVSAASTAMTALYAAGGPTDIGSLRRVSVQRGGRTVATLDVYDYLLRGDASKDVRLEQGDIVYVPIHGRRVRVDGEVRRPATYEMNERETLADAIAAAGGFRPTAVQRRLVVDRVLPPAQRVPGGGARATIDVALGSSGEVPAFPLADGDVVRVPAVADRVLDRITVRGNVYTEGAQGYSTELTLEQALKRAGVKPDVYLGQVLISRLRGDSTRMQLRAALRDSTGATVEPFMLAPDDEITVFSRTTFRSDAFVVIGGAVRRSGRYPWREGMTLRDLVLMAGGLQEGAYLKEAEIARVPTPRTTEQLAKTMRVPLDSSYLFDRVNARAGSSDPLLMPHDNVLILREPDWSRSRSIVLTGEVRFPGRYTLLTRGDRISDVIDRAGGLTRLADADAAYFARPLAVSSYQTLRDSALYAGDSARAEAGGRRIRVGVDLDRALHARGSSDNLVLADGDSLHIPSRRQTVEIRGEVNAPTALAATGRRSLEYYINAAGGPTVQGDARRAYVIQPNGKIESRHKTLWILTSDPSPRPGSVVVVPQREAKGPPGNGIASAAVVAQMLASVVAIIALAR
jgi:polysaccharide export outer membrane protein